MKRKELYVAVTITLALLGGLATETLSRPRPKDAEAYHARAYAAQWVVPLQFGAWHGSELKPKPAAMKLLRPNFIMHRRYVHADGPRRAVDLLIVHCRDARDMAGHYPPICYPAHGYTKIEGLNGVPFTIVAGGRSIAGMEYGYTRMDDGGPTSCVVSNVLVLPSGEFPQGMDEVKEAAADYLRQFYGAAQVQVVMDATVPLEERRKIVADFLGAITPVLDVLSSGGTR